MTVILYRNAWMGDDAFITFRTVDNLINGYGLTWNVIERVQSFTHPLWMLLVAGAYAVTGEIFITVLLLSMALTLAAAAAYAFRVAGSTVTAVLGIVFMMLSKAFIDYSSSGLENPLSFLIVVLFFVTYISKALHRKKLFMLTLLMSLGMLNRMDLVLLMLPAVIFIFFRQPRLGNLKIVLLGMSPIIVWILFALFYYGFPFPNTAYAKLNTGIDTGQLIRQGLFYLRNNSIHGPMTAIIIAGGILAGLFSGSRKFIPFSIGLILYLIYIVRIGGDFMMGRFLAVPFLCALMILSRCEINLGKSIQSALASALVVLGLLWPCSPVWSGAAYGTGPEKGTWDRGISDERAGGFQENGLINVSLDQPLPANAWAEEGRQIRKAGDTLIYRSGIGFYGFCAGPRVYIVDGHSLTDPLRSRLIVRDKVSWRIGHFYRVAPFGYLETLRSGINQIKDSSLAEYYDRIRLVVRGDLFDFNRIKEIIRFNLGLNDFLVEDFLKRPLQLEYSDVSRYVKPGTAYNANCCYIMNDFGINVDFGKMIHPSSLEISLDHNDSYRIIFYRDTIVCDSQNILADWDQKKGLAVHTLPIDSSISIAGFNNITIIPVSGYGGFSLGHIRYFQ